MSRDQNDAGGMGAGPSWVDRHLPQQDAPYGHAQPAGHALIDIAAIRGLMWRQRYVLGGVIAAAVLLGLLATLLMRPVYQATASVRVEPKAGVILAGQDLIPTVPSNEVNRYLQTLAAIVQSRSMSYRVTDALKLDSDAAFLGALATQPKPEGISDSAWKRARRDAAVAKLQGNLKVEVPDLQRIILISFRSTDPQQAARIANSYVDNFINEDIREAVESNSYAHKYLEDQISQTRIRLQDAEIRANSYARNNRIISQNAGAINSGKSGEDEASQSADTMTVSMLARISEAYSEARTKRIVAQERWKAIAAAPAAQLQEVRQNSAVQSLVVEAAKLAAKLADLRQRYGESHPQVQEAAAEIAALNRQIAREGADIRSSLRNDYEVALKQEQGLAAELARVSEMTLDEQDRRVQFNILDREAEGLRTQLAALLERYNQIASAANVKSGNFTKLDAAAVPGAPVSPNMAKNLFAAFVLGAGLALVIAVLREVLYDRIRSADDVERKLGMPILGLTPLVEEGEVNQENRRIGEAYSTIRTSIEFALPRSDRNILVFTSSQSSEGKTTSAVFFAMKSAQLGRKVLLVDADLRKPSVAGQFGVNRNNKGFVEVLLGECTFAEALLRQPQENLDVLPVGPIPSNPVDVLSSPLVRQFVERHAPNYAFIIFDSPPVMGLADTPLLTRYADGVVFFVESNKAHVGQTRQALRRLRDAGANVLGVVLTKFKALDAGLSYDYEYHYYSYGEGGKK